MAHHIPSILRTTDTPTICNALEIVMGNRTTEGFTKTPVTPLDPSLPPMVGYAATAIIRADRPPDGSPAETTLQRLAYYEYLERGVAERPIISVVHDVSSPIGIGAFWGEVNVAIHLGLGVSGAITDGSMRDLDEVDGGFQILAGMVSPSHAHVHVDEIDIPVTVFGMVVQPGDLIHADRHGAVVIQPHQLERLPEAIAQIQASEAPILHAARSPEFSTAQLRELWGVPAGDG